MVFFSRCYSCGRQCIGYQSVPPPLFYTLLLLQYSFGQNEGLDAGWPILRAFFARRIGETSVSILDRLNQGAYPQNASKPIKMRFVSMSQFEMVRIESSNLGVNSLVSYRVLNCSVVTSKGQVGMKSVRVGAQVGTKRTSRPITSMFFTTGCPNVIRGWGKFSRFLENQRKCSGVAAYLGTRCEILGFGYPNHRVALKLLVGDGAGQHHQHVRGRVFGLCCYAFGGGHYLKLGLFELHCQRK